LEWKFVLQDYAMPFVGVRGGARCEAKAEIARGVQRTKEAGQELNRTEDDAEAERAGWGCMTWHGMPLGGGERSGRDGSA
jgi:hypothetical protein